MSVNAVRYRSIRVNGRVDSMSALKAASLVSRGLAEYVTDDPKPKRRGRPKGSKNKPKPEPAVYAEQVYSNPSSPVTPTIVEDSTLPGSSRQGDVADIAGDMPHHLE